MSAPARRHDAGEIGSQDAHLMPPTSVLPAAPVRHGPIAAIAESESFDRRRTPPPAPMGHLLPRAPTPNGDAMCCTVHGTPPGTSVHAENPHIIANIPPRS